MTDLLVYTIIPLILLVLILIAAVYFAWFFLEFLKKYRLNMVKRSLSEKFVYNCYFVTEEDIKSDEQACQIASISYKGYVEKEYEFFYERLDENHLPLHILLNWAKTIVEDLRCAVSPINHVKRWNAFFQSMEYSDLKETHPDYINFGLHELAYLWGVVYYWLKTYVDKMNDVELLNYIESVACRKQFLRPYFYHYKNLADGVNSPLIYEADSTIKSVTKGITSEQTALLWLAIANLTEKTVTKKSLAPSISTITGVGKTAIERNITGSFKESDKVYLAGILEDQMPNLAAQIRKM